MHHPQVTTSPKAHRLIPLVVVKSILFRIKDTSYIDDRMTTLELRWITCTHNLGFFVLGEALEKIARERLVAVKCAIVGTNSRGGHLHSLGWRT